ncbi:S-adenosyl-L-methionine-dependent methyltransferase [Multifurca ochricompacta]|uniref:tRNA (cytosine(38)-C(5))-methyltransferase n=1 Tax=Multifurca ochricompacta TaxID=376703 RepID=A0AAD4M087_9AGAM|nr:S-adenosyl-L-methionine-dependent methyltransferase [Multifurca ochricompacta]
MFQSIRAIEFYSGIGGLHLALSRSSVGDNATVVRAFDWDQLACAVYTANHGPGIAHRVDITMLNADMLGPLNADLWLLSPACQPYTVLNPNAKGAADPRAQSFLHLMEGILPALAERGAAPTRLLIENVAGFEVSTTRTRVLDVLTKLGFTTDEFLLTPLQLGVPNSRLRYYLLASRASAALITPMHSDRILRHIPGRGMDWDWENACSLAAPETAENKVQPLRDYLDGHDALTAHAVPDRVLTKWGRLFDIVLPSAARTCCFTRGYTQLVERTGSILQENEELDTTVTFDKFLFAQASGDEQAVEILRPLRLRYFSPGELLRLFCFEDVGSVGTFRWPVGISTKTKYRLIGNSVNVLVVTTLIEHLCRRPD